MALLKVEAQKLSNDMLRAGVIENIITSDEVFSMLPFIPVNGRTYRYTREATLGSASFIDVGDTITESAATFTSVSEDLRRIVGDVDVDEFLQGTHSDATDQAATQISKKAKVVGRTYADRFITGDNGTNPKEFDGLIQLCPAAQSFLVATNGAALSFDFLDQLIDLVKIGGQRVFIMNSRTRRAFINLARGVGGTQPETLVVEGIVGPVTAYRGIAILRNDFVPIDQVAGTETAATTVFLAALDEDEGVAGLMAQSQAGIEVEDVGPVQTEDARRWRVKWYASLALHSELAMACATGVNN
ncbi:hypothetical protein LCGC14_0401500 [marine sediment metagenome]|uniref:Major capsid protein n=1 Tax=marine sediment metagenome TaxID=412755 RepID=A0A0F9TES9_9ZZZZ